MWFKAYNWEENPFSIKPNRHLVGMEGEKKRLVEYILGSNICLLTGSIGTGKTSLLKYIQSELGNEHRVVYLNAEEIDEFFQMRRYLNECRTLLERILFREPRNIVLLLDEGQAADERLKDWLKAHYDRGVFKSIVIAQTKPPFEYSESLKHRIGNRVVRMESLDDRHVEELINLRTNSRHPFDTETIQVIAKYANYNPRKILEICEGVCIELADKSPEKIMPEHIESVLESAEEHRFCEEPYLLQQKPSKPAAVDMGGVDRLGFSPMQRRIVRILLESSMTAKQLADVLHSTEGSVGKQLSVLGEIKVVVTVDSRRPKVYGVSGEFREDLKLVK